MLLGIAEDPRDGSVVRTAVVSFEDEMHLVREGEHVLARYLVVRITGSQVELKDLVDGETFTVALR